MLKFKPTGQLYYGASYANSKTKTANPVQLWDTYFTSSRHIKNLIKIQGKDSFEFQIRQIFETAEQALKCEKKVLTKFNAKFNNTWLNKSNGYGSLGHTTHTEETKEKISKANKGRKLPVKTKEHREKLSIANKGKKISEYTKQKLIESNTGRKMPDHVKEKLRELSKGRIPWNKGKKTGLIPWNKKIKTQI